MSHVKLNNSSVVKRHMDSACSSEDYNRSSAKRLFSSVFKIVIVLFIQIDTDDN